jgi:hypothetical protein
MLCQFFRDALPFIVFFSGAFALLNPSIRIGKYVQSQIPQQFSGQYAEPSGEAYGGLGEASHKSEWNKRHKVLSYEAVMFILLGVIGLLLCLMIYLSPSGSFENPTFTLEIVFSMFLLGFVVTVVLTAVYFYYYRGKKEPPFIHVVLDDDRVKQRLMGVGVLLAMFPLLIEIMC